MTSCMYDLTFILTHGRSDWSSVHLARKTADAATTEGRNFKNP
jgi:hypothetical protein